MKKIYSFIIILLITIAQLGQLSAQINTIVTAKAHLFPSSGLDYMSDPTQYFTVMVINTSATEEQMYISINLTCDFTATGQSFNLSTPTNKPPLIPITVPAGGTVTISRQQFTQLFSQMTGADITMSGISWQDALLLPEGNYRICVTPYRWMQAGGQPVQIGEPGCCPFSICYSGSAPEFTSPLIGQSAANLNNSNPLNTLSGDRRRRIVLGHNALSNGSGLTSDNRDNSQYASISMQRNLTFRWVGVISNCLSSNDFNYIFKIVEVYPSQNVQDAIVRNPTLATVNTGSKLFYTHDTLANRHFRLQVGHVYAAQVQAVVKPSLNAKAVIGNEGKSQVITFEWGDVPVVTDNNGTSVSYSEEDNKEAVIQKIRNPYLISPIRDQHAIDSLTMRFPEEASHIPEITDTIAFLNDAHLYQLHSSELPISWMPLRGDSVMDVQYNVSLYEYVSEDIHLSLNLAPIISQDIQVTKDANPDAFSVNHYELMNFVESSWADTLKQGFKYIVKVSALAHFAYNNTFHKTMTEFIDGIPTNTTSDSVVAMVGSAIYNTNIAFQWGVDSGALSVVTPAQLSYPVDLSDADVDHYVWDKVSEVEYGKDFKFFWHKAQGLSINDTATYNVVVCKLINEKRPEECLKDTFLIAKDITESEYFQKDWYDSLKVGNSYVAYIQTNIKNNAKLYNLKNNGRSLLGTFKLVQESEFTADLNHLLECHPGFLDSLSKKVITPKVDSLINNKVRLKMGDFPLVIQKAKYDETKKNYSGEGYVVWKPFSYGECWIKVKIDTIQINDKYEIIRGSATGSITDDANYVNMGFGYGWSDWTDDKLNKLAAKFGNNSSVKKYYTECNKYSNLVHGLASAFSDNGISTGVLTLPLKVDDEAISGAKNMMISIDNMFFSPNTALMNLIAVFHSNEENIYVPLVATNVCMNPQSFLSGAVDGIDLYLGKSYEIELNDGYVMRFKASSKLGDPKDGTYLSINNKGFKEFAIEVQFDMGKELLGIDPASSTPQKGKIVHAGLSAKIADWDNWYTKIYMDPFAVENCSNFTFVPTGKGIYYDHSKTVTPQDVSFPKDYVVDENKNKWEGFYMNEFSVLLSDDISNTFTNDNHNKDSMVIYKYGVNNTVIDSVHYSYPGSRINFGAKDLIIDDNGFTVELFARDIVKASTSEGGGWSFSLDTISVKFEKNKYKFGWIYGTMGIPLFKGKLKYDCAIGADSLDFAVTPKDKEFLLDMWAAKINFDDKSSYFKIRKIYKESRTRIDLTLNGKINIDFHKLDLPISFNLVKFEHMGLRNYNFASPDARTAQLKDLDFDLGEWSWASPQKTLGGAASDGDGNVTSGKFGGFSYSLKTLSPFMTPADHGYLKIGLTVAGTIGFSEGNSFDIGAGAGFKIWGLVNTNTYDIKDVDGKLDSIHLETDLQVFKMKGDLHFFDASDQKEYGDGFAGNVEVTILGNVTVRMAAGFGTAKDNNEHSYKWWFVEGAANFGDFGVPLGPINLTGLSGGFAYNMDCKTSLANYPVTSLLTSAQGSSDEYHSTGMEFVPHKNSWVAKAGVSLAMSNKKILSGSGVLTLRVSEGKFSGIFINVEAYILNGGDVTPTNGADVASDNSKSNQSFNSILKAQGIIGYEQTTEYRYFRLSISATAKIDLTSLLEAATSSLPVAADAICETIKKAGYGGKNLLSENVLTLPTDEVEQIRQANADANSEASHNFFGVSASLSVPIDLEVKYYLKSTVVSGKTKKAKSTDWYFSIGKPDPYKCVRFEMSKNILSILSASATFTMYLITGNSFDYTLPPLDDEVAAFFNKGTSKNEQDVQGNSVEKINKERAISTANMINIKGAGGFALGATFKAEMEFSFFLYVKVMASLGFDVALLDVHGQGCEGYTRIGKNDFYGLGRVYAMMEGEVGLRLNLGFWKGDIPLLSAGIGALLQGGAPNPSWAYGLLRLKVSCLGGLVKINTSVDFTVGDVCVPGAGDPLANVKLFQNITPSFTSANDAKQKKNLVSPFDEVTIVSNMPWNEEVVLVTDNGKKSTARKFKFIMWEAPYQNQISVSSINGSSFSTYSSPLEFTRSQRDANTMYFHTKEGGLPDNKMVKIRLCARALEWRTFNSNLVNASVDFPYNLSSFVKQNSRSSTSPDWYDPEYAIDKKHSQCKPYLVDTTFFIGTRGMDSTLKNQVVYTWPYNGEVRFPTSEFGTSPNGYDECYIFLRRNRMDLLDKQTLSGQGKELKVFLMSWSGERNEKAVECSYDYVTSYQNPLIKIYIDKSQIKENTAYKIKLLVINKDQYESYCTSAMNNMQSETSAKYELTQRNLAYGNQSSGQSSSQSRGQIRGHNSLPVRNSRAQSSRASSEALLDQTPTPPDIKKSQYQAWTDELNKNGADTSMLYKRISINPYAYCNKNGVELYSLCFCTTDKPTFAQYIKKLENAGIFNSMNKWVNGNSPIYSASGTSGYYSHYLLSSDWANRNSDNPAFSYLFFPYETNNMDQYASGITLPPLFYFTIDLDHSASINPLLRLHRTYTQEFCNLQTDFKKTYPVLNVWNRSGRGSNPAMRTSEYYENLSQLRSGLYKNTNTFTGIDYRTKLNKAGGTCMPTTYYPEINSNGSLWSCPNVLPVITYQSNNFPRITNTSFDGNNTTHTLSQDIDQWYITDYATPAICDDIMKFFYFFQENQAHAAYLNGRGFSHKIDYLSRYYSDKTRYFMYSYVHDFPYDMPEIYLTTHYFSLYNYLRGAGRAGVIDDCKNCYSMTDYLYNNNSTYAIFDENNRVSNNQAAFWLKYWFRMKGVPNATTDQGINHSYYYSNNYSNLFGNWYTATPEANNLPKSTLNTKYYLEIDYLSKDGTEAIAGNSSNFLNKLAAIAATLTHDIGTSDHQYFEVTSRHPINVTIPVKIEGQQLNSIYSTITTTGKKLIMMDANGDYELK